MLKTSADLFKLPLQTRWEPYKTKDWSYNQDFKRFYNLFKLVTTYQTHPHSKSRCEKK